MTPQENSKKRRNEREDFEKIKTKRSRETYFSSSFA
jgi:hypothetical protein